MITDVCFKDVSCMVNRKFILCDIVFKICALAGWTVPFPTQLFNIQVQFESDRVKFTIRCNMLLVIQVIFLITRAGVSDKDIGKVIALGPELLGCNIAHKLEVNVKYFRSLGIHLSTLGEMIADFPMLLRYNIDVLRPKYSYLRRTMVRPLRDLIEFPR